MKNLNFILTILLLITACSKNDDTIVLAPEFIVEPMLTANYFQHGEGPLPEVHWNGNRGKFGLENTIKGLSINKETGQLSWDNSMPVGVHTITIFAYNEAGKKLESLIINNQFQGTFKGTFSTNSNFSYTLFKVMEIIFNENGTFIGNSQSELKDGDILGPNYFSGNYVLIDNKMNGTLQYEDNESTYPLEADLNKQGKLIGQFTNELTTTTFKLNFLIQQ
ncbi:hypothetical protein [Aurantibacter sp.]|uniref:hypothetical protein n=1 Tax=Aurantibacter sp. TaxID=2807103 RepID=UPI003265A00F